MKQFELSLQWQKYLQLVGLKEETMHPVQLVETKRAFYGGCGQMLRLVSETADLSEDEATDALDSVEKQVNNFWFEQSINHSRSN